MLQIQDKENTVAIFGYIAVLERGKGLFYLKPI